MGEFVGLADDEALKGEARIERRAGKLGFPGHARRVGCPRGAGGCRLEDHRLGHRAQVGRRDVELDALDIDAVLAKLVQDRIGEVARHPVAHELGRDFEPRDAVLQGGQPQGLDPADEVVFPDDPVKFPADLPPRILGHVFLAQFCLLRRAQHAPNPTKRPQVLIIRRQRPTPGVPVAAASLRKPGYSDMTTSRRRSECPGQRSSSAGTFCSRRFSSLAAIIRLAMRTVRGAAPVPSEVTACPPKTM